MWQFVKKWLMFYWIVSDTKENLELFNYVLMND